MNIEYDTDHKSAQSRLCTLYCFMYFSLSLSLSHIHTHARARAFIYILGVVKRNPLFFHSISCKNNGFLFITSNIYIYIYIKHNLFFIFNLYFISIYYKIKNTFLQQLLLVHTYNFFLDVFFYL